MVQSLLVLGGTWMFSWCIRRVEKEVNDSVSCWLVDLVFWWTCPWGNTEVLSGSTLQCLIVPFCLLVSIGIDWSVACMKDDEEFVGHGRRGWTKIKSFKAPSIPNFTFLWGGSVGCVTPMHSLWPATCFRHYEVKFRSWVLTLPCWIERFWRWSCCPFPGWLADKLSR